MLRVVASLSVGCAVLLALGCGSDKPKLVTVTGKVVFKNEPLTAGSIWFVPDLGNAYQGEKPSCQLQLDGSFTMRTYPFGDGVPPGAYKVMLSPELANRIKKPEYGDAAKTPLTLTVPDVGVRDHVIDVK